MLEKIIIISLFTLIIHTIETLSYAVRLSGVRTGKIAVSLSLFNIIVILSRTVYTLQALMTGSLVDHAKNMGQLGELKTQFQIIFSFGILWDAYWHFIHSYLCRPFLEGYHTF